MNQLRYPALEMNLRIVRQNAETLASLLAGNNMTLTGVVKGFHALPKVVDQFVAGGCRHIASSRLEQLAHLKKLGYQLPLMLLRIPMASEIEELVQMADISLNSEPCTIEALAESSLRQGRRHGVILMQDMGDLREGFFDPQELIATALHIENNLKSLTLKGIGTNLGCYGAVKPSVENLGMLSQTASEIEKRIGRPLEIVSGGATSSIPLLLDGKMPKGINNLRVGEAILTSRDLSDYWKITVPGLQRDAFILKAQVVEVKQKPSLPVGEMFVDAFGGVPEFTDRGIRHRAILAVGKQDIGDPFSLIPLTPGMEVVGGSSDHLIVDIEDCREPITVGDVVSFSMYYSPMLFLSGSRSIRKIYRKG